MAQIITTTHSLLGYRSSCLYSCLASLCWLTIYEQSVWYINSLMTQHCLKYSVK